MNTWEMTGRAVYQMYYKITAHEKGIGEFAIIHNDKLIFVFLTRPAEIFGVWFIRIVFS